MSKCKLQEASKVVEILTSRFSKKAATSEQELSELKWRATWIGNFCNFSKLFTRLDLAFDCDAMNHV